MQKRSVINRVYRATWQATSHIYRDSDWTGVKGIFSAINGALPTGCSLSMGEARYEGVMGECGHCKVYTATIIDAESCKDIKVQLIASFCGTVSDPMGAYDLTLIMN